MDNNTWKTTVGINGTCTIRKGVRDALGMKQGDTVYLEVIKALNKEGKTIFEKEM